MQSIFTIELQVTKSQHKTYVQVYIQVQIHPIECIVLCSTSSCYSSISGSVLNNSNRLNSQYIKSVQALKESSLVDQIEARVWPMS